MGMTRSMLAPCVYVVTRFTFRGCGRTCEHHRLVMSPSLIRHRVYFDHCKPRLLFSVHALVRSSDDMPTWASWPIASNQRTSFEFLSRNGRRDSIRTRLS